MSKAAKKNKKKIGVAPNCLTLAMNAKETAIHFGLPCGADGFLEELDEDWSIVATNPRAARKTEEELSR